MVYAVYFSPTGTSKKNSVAVAGEFCEDFEEVDLTVLSKVKDFKANASDLVVFSFPVYGGRILAQALSVMNNFKGENTPCICLVTYGNRAYDFALAELCTFVSERGFLPFAGGALIGKHTYGEIATDRPNEEDFAKAKEFFGGYKEKLQSGEISILKDFTSFESETKGKGGRFFPMTNDKCVFCGACARLCPVGAISFENFKVDSTKCIACFRCINRCLAGAKNMDDPAYIQFAEGFSEKLSQRVENEYFGC